MPNDLESAVKSTKHRVLLNRLRYITTQTAIKYEKRYTLASLFKYWILILQISHVFERYI